MRILTSPDAKWFGLLILLCTILLKTVLAPTDYLGISILGVGLACLIGIIVWSYSSLPEAKIYWDDIRGIFSIFSFWSVEIISARLLGSVPIGIDLSHSGRKVLQSMYTRFLNEPNGELVFFIVRPLGNEPTKIGFLVKRRTLRLWNGFDRVEKISKNLTTDAIILERAMRASYPHLPVEVASFQDIIKVTTGGLETHVLV